MSKNRKNKSGNPRKQAIANPNRKTINWNAMLKKSGLFVAVLALVGFSIGAYSHLVKIEHDLTVVGNGTATVVQIHDPNCPMCQRLKHNLESVKGDFKNDIQFKIANLSSQKGRQFARQYNAPSVTLLMFNERGKMVEMLEGVTPTDEINDALLKLSRRD